MSVKSDPPVFFLLIWLSRLGVSGLVIAAAISLDAAITEQHRNGLKQAWQTQVDEIALNLQAEILQNVQTVWGLAANVAIEPDIDDDRFNQLAPVLFRLAPELKNIGLAPDLTIRHVYPLRGNEAAIGLDLTRQSLPPEDVKALKESRRAIFNGPIDLVQGGKGLASRIPIFTKETDEFWGVVSVILDLNKLYDTVNLAEYRRDLRFVLASSSDVSDTKAIFFGPRSTEWSDPVSSTLRMPGTTWTIFAEPSNGWPTAPENPLVFRGSLILVAGLIISALFWLTHLMLRDREMQLRFWGLFELAPLGVGLFNARNGRVIRANPQFRKRFGHKADTLDFFEQGFQRDGTMLEKPLALQKRLRASQRISDIEVYYPTDETTVAPVNLRGLKLLETSRDPVIWLIAEDISEQKKVETMKNEFISTISHELRTPLTSISGSLGLLTSQATGQLPDSMARMIGIAHRNSLQLTHIINDLLDIDKLVAGKMKFRMENLILSDLVKESVENIGHYARERQVRLELSFLHDVRVITDRQRLTQALNNLLSNAIKFSPSNGAVTVFSQLRNGRVRLCVRDEGEGIPEAFRPQIFEKFSQADGSSRRQKGGTGLGLAITRELMTQMNGSVDFESKPAEGAIFWLEMSVLDEKTR
ncbi:ATP-binding protein [Marinobacter sp. CHS3-4]|uniref:ATP-binding protein n=1 Tax=Marinobacter sp. CHS3-4 TaxID=3045174 RepID=UPI0024B52495|nr:ATP-binding protein [Marinobacter sp. CHS3-4]MDI9244020.1 ATP-binding protein [Marinobacter sp. CHS3-4]